MCNWTQDLQEIIEQFALLWLGERFFFPHGPVRCGMTLKPGYANSNYIENNLWSESGDTVGSVDEKTRDRRFCASIHVFYVWVQYFVKMMINFD